MLEPSIEYDLLQLVLGKLPRISNSSFGCLEAHIL